MTLEISSLQKIIIIMTLGTAGALVFRVLCVIDDFVRVCVYLLGAFIKLVFGARWLHRSCFSPPRGEFADLGSIVRFTTYVAPPPSLKKAAALVNGVESGKFSRLLSRVLQKLHLKVGINWNRQFAWRRRLICVCHR